MNNTGFCEIIYGPMKSGKTSRLLQLYKQFQFCEIPVMVINHSMDKRYSDTLLSSHDKLMIPCINTCTLTELVDVTKDLFYADIVTGTGTGTDTSTGTSTCTGTGTGTGTDTGTHIQEFLKSQVILINEAQFFGDIVPWVTIAVEKYKKHVYVCGLNSDFRRKPFGTWLELELICDKVTQLTSWCGFCKKREALFSHRISYETDTIVIGSDNYIPVCRKCWLTVNP